MQVLQLVISGIAQGCIYGLIALGFVLIYKATETVNFAQGELMMLGAFGGFIMMATFGLSFWVAAPLAVVHFVWLVKSDIREPLAYGAAVAALLLLRAPSIRRAITNNQLVPIETVGLTARSSLAAAIADAKDYFSDTDRFLLMLDVRTAREEAVTPLPLGERLQLG